jgi:hypothetical protein
VNDYEFAAGSRDHLVFGKEKLYQLGGVRPDPILKWANK